jgi:hypothetical protein
MQGISLLCIPVNTAIIYFTGNGSFTNSENSESSLEKFLTKQDKTFWTNSNIIMLAIAIEHILFIIKYLVAVLTSDVPNSVLQRESKKDDCEINA